MVLSLPFGLVLKVFSTYTFTPGSGPLMSPAMAAAPVLQLSPALGTTGGQRGVPRTAAMLEQEAAGARMDGEAGGEQRDERPQTNPARTEGKALPSPLQPVRSFVS